MSELSEGRMITSTTVSVEKGQLEKTPLDVSSSSSAAPPPPTPWIDLPSDVTANIFQRLGVVDILESAQKVCTTWRSVSHDPSIWRVINMSNLGRLHAIIPSINLLIMCRNAVDRSHGQLIDISIELFGTNNLLIYIAERCNHLKRLQIALCSGISGQGLSEAVKHFPKLEELHLFFMTFVEPDDIEAIGNSCPNLKSFTFNNRGYMLSTLTFPGEDSDNYALAISTSMPYLQHLGLLGDSLTNDGLKTVLDSCPLLESLDLRQCFSVDMGGDLGKRCSQRIKDLRFPDDSTDDYRWDSVVYAFNPSFLSGLSDDGFLSDLSGGFSYEEGYDDYMDPFGLDYDTDVEFSSYEEFL